MIKKTIAVFLLTTLTGVGVWSILFHSAKAPIEECANVFSSSLYTHYHRQLKEWISRHPFYERRQALSPTAFNKEVSRLVDAIQRPLGMPQEQRASHETFVSQLRALALSPAMQNLREEETHSRQLVEDLIRWIFLQADLKADLQAFLYQHVLPPSEDLFSYLLDTQNQLRTNPLFDGIEHACCEEDQFLQGNLPSKLPSPLTAPGTQLIRLGHPLRHLSRRHWWRSPTVYPEFLLFLHLQPSHLYVNLMKRKGLEGRATRSLEALEFQVMHLYVITLDKNSPFYWQDEEAYVDLWESASFKNAFLDQMLLEEGNYFWSRRLDLATWKEELRLIVDGIHAGVFNYQVMLDRVERQDFIELTYLAILDRLVEKWHPASMNITCRQGMDRGPSLMTLWMLQKNELSHSEAAALLLAPPLIIHNRASHASRIERFVSAAKRFMSARKES